MSFNAVLISKARKGESARNTTAADATASDTSRVSAATDGRGQATSISSGTSRNTV
jgi:hypothetical protein